MNGYRAAALALALVAATPTAAQYRPAPRTLTEADNNRTLRLDIGDELRVRLPIDAAAVSDWEMRRDQRIEQVRPAMTEGGRPGTVGARHRVFHISPLEAGRFTIIYSLRTMAPGADRPRTRRVFFTLDVVEPDRRDPDYGDQTLTEDDANGIIRLAAGREVTVRLRSNPSTGYHWEVMSSSNMRVRQPRQEETRRGGPVRVGADETTVFQFVPQEPGRAELWLGYVPPGRGGLQMAPRIVHYRFEVD